MFVAIIRPGLLIANCIAAKLKPLSDALDRMLSLLSELG